MLEVISEIITGNNFFSFKNSEMFIYIEPSGLET